MVTVGSTVLCLVAVFTNVNKLSIQRVLLTGSVKEIKEEKLVANFEKSAKIYNYVGNYSHVTIHQKHCSEVKDE